MGMRIAVVGMGFVGLTLAAFLAAKSSGNTVYGIESDPKRLSRLTDDGRPDFFEPKLDRLIRRHSGGGGNLRFLQDPAGVFDSLDYVFITVGTPTVNGRIVLTHIRKSVRQIAGHLDGCSGSPPAIVVKSTLSPRTTGDVILPILEERTGRKLGSDLFLATNPEFLREGTAVDDQFSPHAVVVGTQDASSLKRMKRLVDRTYPRGIPRFFTNFATSELIKYANNAFLATKISFINSIANLCEKIPGTNVDDVAGTIGTDPRIGPLFLKAGPGYGGSCLPKDLSSLITVFRKNGVDPSLLLGVESVNDGQTDQILRTIRDCTGRLEGKTLTVLGLSFKEDSDDIRESRSIRLIRRLLEGGRCRIRVHDPAAVEKTREIFGGRIEYFEDVGEALRRSDCAVVMTPWRQYAALSDFSMMSRGAAVIDTRRIVKDTGRVRYIPYGSAPRQETL